MRLALDDDELDELADVLAERIAARVAERLREESREDHWLSTKDAAAYLGLSVPALHKLTAARTIPFMQDKPGGKCWFKRSDLDSWRAS